MSSSNGTEAIVNEVIDAVLVYFSTMEAPIHRYDIVSKNRSPYVVKVRGVVMYYLKTVLEMPYTQIGTLLERDHTSVLAAVRNIAQKMDREELADVSEYVQARVRRIRDSRKAALMGELAS